MILVIALKKWLKETFYKDGEPNFSNRDLIVLSGTIPRSRQ